MPLLVSVMRAVLIKPPQINPFVSGNRSGHGGFNWRGIAVRVATGTACVEIATSGGVKDGVSWFIAQYGTGGS